MTHVSLGDVCEINPRKPSGLNSDADCTFVPMEYVDESLGAIVKADTRRIGEVEKGYTSFRDEDVLFAKITPCMENGKCAIAKNLVNGIGFGSTEFHVVRAKEQIIPQWVYYFLRQEPLRKEAERNMTGSAGQQRVPTQFLSNALIPLPPLDEQRRIADILSRADRLRRLRRTALDLSDGYLQSVFLEMFGDPVENPMGWEIKPLGKVVKNLDSKRIPIKESDRADRQGPYPYYGATGIIDHLDDYIFDETTLLIAEDGKNLRHRTKPIAFMAHGKYWVNNHAHVVKGNGKVELLYLMESLNYRDIDSFVTGIDQFKLTRSSLDTIPIQVPPLVLQQKFAGIVRQVERLRTQQREAARQAEGLFQALLHRMFNS